jgi:hypothetical protein
LTGIQPYNEYFIEIEESPTPKISRIRIAHRAYRIKILSA